MIAVEASVEIAASPQRVWDYVARIDDWWLVSNPDEHVELSVIGDDKTIAAGSEFVLREKIAGVRGDAVVTIADFQPPRRLEWRSLRASYRLLGLALAVDEGGVFEAVGTASGCVLSHRVWGTVSSRLLRRPVEWAFKTLLGGERRDYEHTRRELEFIKREIEGVSGLNGAVR